MKLVVLGASRGTGLHVVKQAIAKGHEVTAIARNVSAINPNGQSPDGMRNNLKRVTADVLSPSTFEDEFQEKDVVISSIGVSNRKPTTLYSHGITNIMEAMVHHNVKRLLCVSGVGVEVTPGMSLPLKILTKFIVQPLLKNNFEDLLRMEDLVMRSQLNWTIIRAPRLTDGKAANKYRVATGDYLTNPLLIGRADLASFIVGNINNEATFRAKVEIAY